MYVLLVSWGQSKLIASETVDVVILGGGSAGLTSAIYLGRAGLTPLVLEGRALGGAITQSNQVENWPGYESISGFDLADKIRLQAEKNGAILVSEELVEIDLSRHPFLITARNIHDPSKQRAFFAKACIIALGAVPKKLGVPGEQEFWSRGVYSCAVCDGSLYKDKIVSVVGGGDAALLEAEYLAGIAKKVYVFVRKDQFRSIEKKREEALLKKTNIEVVYNVSIKEIKGKEGQLEEVELIDSLGKSSFVHVDAVFLAIGANPNTKFFEKQLLLDKGGYILSKGDCETSVPGVFVAGDVSDPRFKQAIIASGDGAKAAMKVQMYLSTNLEKTQKIKAPISKVIEIKNIEQLKDVISSNSVPVLIDFYATWCPPCRYLSRFVDSWAKDLQGKAILCKVNVDEAEDVAAYYKIRSMPTVVALSSDGSEMSRKIGPEEIIRYVELLKGKD